MRWFGEPWGARICDIAPRIPTPIGARCFLCPQPIGEHDAGLVIPSFDDEVTGQTTAHLACLIESLVGPDQASVEADRAGRSG